MSVKGVLGDVTGFTELRGVYRTLGAWKFIAMMGLLLAYAGTLVALSNAAVWPGTCDHEGRKLMGLMKQYYCSPDLLSGGAIELGLFVSLWFLPTACLVAVALSWIFHFRRRRVSNKIVE